MAFSKLAIGATFTVNGTDYRKTCPVSAESTHYVRLFGATDIVTL